MRVLVTGGSGFIGRVVVSVLVAAGHDICLALRRPWHSDSFNHVEQRVVGEIDSQTAWTEALADVDAVVHLAARAHVMRESNEDLEAAFFETNAAGTRRLAAKCCGHVKRFIYISSIGVHGSASPNGPVTECSPIAPDAAYARSKAQAESHLQELSANGHLDCRILRPPLVYGPHAPGNLARLESAIRRGIPLPLGAVDNRRSLISADHLAQAIVAMVNAESARRSAYVVADHQVVSTAGIIRAIARGLDCSPRLWSLPPGLLKTMGSIAGRRHTVDQLIGNLEVDASKFRHEFGDLQPSETLQGLTDAARTLAQ